MGDREGEANIIDRMIAFCITDGEESHLTNSTRNCLNYQKIFLNVALAKEGMR